MKENLKPYVYKQTKHYDKCDVVLFVERSSELRCIARLNTRRYGAEGKPSLNRARELCSVDPKPGDLSMARLKVE